MTIDNPHALPAPAPNPIVEPPQKQIWPRVKKTAAKANENHQPAAASAHQPTLSQQQPAQKTGKPKKSAAATKQTADKDTDTTFNKGRKGAPKEGGQITCIKMGIRTAMYERQTPPKNPTKEQEKHQAACDILKHLIEEWADDLSRMLILSNLNVYCTLMRILVEGTDEGKKENFGNLKIMSTDSIQIIL